MANITRNQLDTLSLANFPNNNSQLISPQDLREWLESGVDSFVTQKDKSTFENAFYEAKGSSLTAASTTFLSNATGNFLHIIGTNGTQIDSFGTCPAGSRFILYFEISAIITYNATTLIIPGSANITTTAGDCMMVISEGSGNWRVVGYFPGTGLPVGTVTAVTATSPISSTGGNAPNISIPQANGSTDGYLDNADWTTFNNKQDTLSAGTGISLASNTVTNTAPDQTVTLNAGTGIGVTGTYPTFTISATGGGGGTPGGANGDFQYKNGSAFDGSNLLRLVSGFIVAHTPKIGDSNTTGHFHMHSANSAPSGLTDYLTMFWQKATRAIGFRAETDTYESYIQMTAPTADRTYTLPDASGNVVIDTTVPSFSNGASSGEIRLLEGSGGGTNYTALKASATLASDYSLILPTTQGGSGQVIVNDGTGQLSWASNGGSTVSKFLGTVSPATVTGTTSETLLCELLIPANTFTAGDCFTILFRARRQSQLVTDRWNFYISNASGIFSGKPLMGFQTIGNIGQFGLTVERNVTIYNATTTYYVNSPSVRYDDFNNDSLSSSNIDWTVPQYIIMTCIPATVGQQIFNVSIHASPR